MLMLPRATLALCSATLLFCVVALDSANETRDMLSDARNTIEELEYRLKTETRRVEFSSLGTPTEEMCDGADRPLGGVVSDVGHAPPACDGAPCYKNTAR